MNILIAFVASIIPVLIILGIIYYQGEVKKQPWWILLIIFIFGIGSWGIVRYVSNLLGQDIYNSQIEVANLLGNKGFFLISFGVIATLEELTKYLILLIMCFKIRYYKNPYDAIMYAVCVSLGFAFIENIMYIFNYGISVALSRAIFTIPSHAAFGIIMGYYFGLSRTCRDSKLNNDAIAMGSCAFFIPFLFHGTYDFLLSIQSDYITYIYLGFVLLLLVFSIYLVFRLHKLDFKTIKNRKYEISQFEDHKQNNKNIYYDLLYKNNKLDSDVSKENSNSSQQQTNWKSTESNKTFVIEDKVEMKMFRNDD